MRSNKKAVSAVIATVLLILITIAAVAIIWGAVRPMLDKTADELESACLTAVVYIGTGSCYNATDAIVVVERKADDFSMAGVQVVLKTATESKETKFNAVSDVIGINGMKTFNVPLAGIIPIKVSIAPIVKVRNAEQTCGSTDTADIKAC